MERTMRLKYFLIWSICYSISTSIFAASKTYDLTVSYKTVNFANRCVQAVAVNDQIPGPELRFIEGDEITINVRNNLDVGTAIHWHGILDPWLMDGVAHVTQMPIPPGATKQYKFKLKQSGTYWYHAHAGLQEQQGLYGAFIIDPIEPPPYAYNKDFNVILSDWINTNPDQVFANLKKDGDYYSPNFPIQPSLMHYLSAYKKANSKERKQLQTDYVMMQTMLMSPYDYSDVAYDKFLINGHNTESPWIQQVKVGDTVRLRFINAGSSTLFKLKIPGTKMQVVHVEGNDVEPYEVDELTISPAETYDIVLKISESKPYIVYAESNDKLGKIYGALITNSQQKIDFACVKPFPTSKPIMMMTDMAETTNTKSESPNSNMDHMSSHANTHDMHSKLSTPNAKSPDIHNATISDMTMHGMDMPSNKYQSIKAYKPSNDPAKPFTPINIRLSGWMDKYIWFMNDKTEYQADPILIEAGKRYRLIFKNETMMHHPMHLHGHWMVIRNGYGELDPKLHTIDIGPHETITVDFDANAETGLWYFHCHNLYHMKAGMARILEYKGTVIPHSLHHEESASGKITAHPAGWYFANSLEFGLNPIQNELYKLTFNSLIGTDYNKLQLHTEEAQFQYGSVQDADLDIFYWHLLDEFWAIKGGINYYYQPSQKPYWQPGVGLEGTMPYFIETNLRLYYTSGSAKLDAIFSRDTQICNNLFIGAAVRAIAATKTVAKHDIGAGLNEIELSLRPFYRIKPGWTIFIEYEHDQYYGVTKRLFQNQSIGTIENLLTLGFTVLF